MSNQERDKFKADYTREFDTCPRGYIVETGEYTNDHAAAAWWGFQAGAAYQRQQDNGLVQALEALIADYDGEIHNEYDGTSMLVDRLAEIDYARKALATYRAAQEGK